jgi:hypothetical protein
MELIRLLTIQLHLLLRLVRHFKSNHSVITAIIVIPIVLLILLGLSCLYIRSKRKGRKTIRERDFLSTSPSYPHQATFLNKGSITAAREASHNAMLVRSASFKQSTSPTFKTSLVQADFEQLGYGNIGTELKPSSNNGQPHNQQYGSTPAPTIYGTYYYQDENNLYIDDYSIEPSVNDNHGIVRDECIALPVPKSHIDPRTISQLESIANSESNTFSSCYDLESGSEMSESLGTSDSIKVVNSMSEKVVIGQEDSALGYER